MVDLKSAQAKGKQTTVAFAEKETVTLIPDLAIAFPALLNLILEKHHWFCMLYAYPRQLSEHKLTVTTVILGLLCSALYSILWW